MLLSYLCSPSMWVWMSLFACFTVCCLRVWEHIRICECVCVLVRNQIAIVLSSIVVQRCLMRFHGFAAVILVFPTFLVALSDILPGTCPCWAFTVFSLNFLLWALEMCVFSSLKWPSFIFIGRLRKLQNCSSESKCSIVAFLLVLSLYSYTFVHHTSMHLPR